MMSKVRKISTIPTCLFILVHQMKKVAYFLFISILLFSCSKSQNSSEDPVQEAISLYPLHVGDIAFDKKIDSSSFELCNENYHPQYYNTGQGLVFEGEKIAIIKHFDQYYDPTNVPKESGYLTIRFIVNCKGETGRYRVQEMDSNYEDIKFSSEISDQLLSLTKSLKGWSFPKDTKRRWDYYQYLTFKIEDGLIIEIMP